MGRYSRTFAVNINNVESCQENKLENNCHVCFVPRIYFVLPWWQSWPSSSRSQSTSWGKRSWSEDLCWSQPSSWEGWWEGWVQKIEQLWLFPESLSRKKKIFRAGIFALHIEHSQQTLNAKKMWLVIWIKWNVELLELTGQFPARFSPLSEGIEG